VRHGTGRLVELRKADRMIVKTIDGGQVSDMTFVGFDQGMTRNFNGWRRFGVPKLAGTLEDGDVLVDGDIKPVLRLIKSHSSAHHDLLFPGCWRELYKDGRPGCRDILCELFGIERKSLSHMATWFMEVKDMRIVPSPAEPGDYVELEALRDVVVGLTSCPDDVECNSKGGDIEITVKSGTADH